MKNFLKNYALFRCKQNSKQPYTIHGFKDAQFNFDIESHVADGFNIGLACEMSGLIVLDCDIDTIKGFNGVNTIKELELKLGSLPKTLTQLTPRGGKHYFFSSKGINNPIGKIGKDIDVKYRGYVLIEPSALQGKLYKFIDGIDENNNIVIAELPNKWLNFINKPIKEEKSNNKIVPTVERKIINGNFQKMYDKCLFIKHCVNYACSLSEPEWHLFACVLNSFSDGDSLFDYYSRPYTNYNPTVTKKKFKNASKYVVNCNTISRIFADCAKCIYHKEENND